MRGAEHKPLTDGLAESAVEYTLALNPLLGISTGDMTAGASALLRGLIRQPTLIGKQSLTLASEISKIATGTSDIEPDRSDRRFSDPAWTSSWLYSALMQTYLAWGRTTTDLASKIDLPERDAALARLMTSILVDAASPTNHPLLNPTALKTLVDTGGRSAIRGVQNFISDLIDNGGLPSSVDASKFRVGDNLAKTPGHVVFHNEVLELIQYIPIKDVVRRRPLLIVPPQINKYYALDLSPDKSIIAFLLDNGIQPYCVSWRNPTAAQSHWGLDTYIEALDEACDVTREISGSDTVNMMGSCSGGITMSTYLAWLAGRNEAKVNAVVVAVCVLDTEADTGSDLSALMTPESLEAAKEMSRSRGVLDGKELARMFAWMRPNDLIWNYWVNNYLLGNTPPAYDVLFWNADTTRLPARLHADYLDLIPTNPFVNAGTIKLLDVPIDLGKADHETYVIAGTTDHITPWKAVYRTARLYGDDTTFILSNSGHIQSLLNPPGKPKAWYVKGAAHEVDPDVWASKADKKEGTWWHDWAAFLTARSSDEIPAPQPGNAEYPPLAPAPGTYVFEP